MAQVSNTSVYLGYQVNVNLGYECRFRVVLMRDVRHRLQIIHEYSCGIIAGLRPHFKEKYGNFFDIINFKNPIEYRRIFICLHLICFVVSDRLCHGLTPRQTNFGAKRVTEGKTFLGRFSEDYANWGEVDYPRQIGNYE